jgi:hypothetical protein
VALPRGIQANQGSSHSRLAAPRATKKNSPSVAGDQQAADQSAERGTALGARIDQRVGQAAVMLRIVVGKDARVGRIGDRFADAQQQAQCEYCSEGSGGAGDGGGSGPQEEAGRQNPADVEAVHQPARQTEELARGVGPEECREKLAELVVGEAEIVLDVGGAGGEVGAVKVIQESGNDEQCENAPVLTGQGRTRRSGNDCHRRLFYR